jgi:hypothetical protein
MTTRASGSSPVDVMHDVRTAINHILGYAAILIDGAEERGMPQLVPLFEAIYGDGIELLDRIQAHPDTAGPAELSLLGTELGPLAEHVLSEVKELAIPASQEELLQDAEVVANACRRLLSLLHSA